LGAGLYGYDWRIATAVVGVLLIYLGLFHKRREHGR